MQLIVNKICTAKNCEKYQSFGISLQNLEMGKCHSGQNVCDFSNVHTNRHNIKTNILIVLFKEPLPVHPPPLPQRISTAGKGGTNIKFINFSDNSKKN